MFATKSKFRNGRWLVDITFRGKSIKTFGVDNPTPEALKLFEAMKDFDLVWEINNWELHVLFFTHKAGQVLTQGQIVFQPRPETMPDSPERLRLLENAIKQKVNAPRDANVSIILIKPDLSS